uniref:Uncharacterized protein n=1 Tax=viral metagenome TaxID=1070528 RepID=A0A2V0RIA3_9ZZZZ
MERAMDEGDGFDAAEVAMTEIVKPRMPGWTYTPNLQVLENHPIFMRARNYQEDREGIEIAVTESERHDYVNEGADTQILEDVVIEPIQESAINGEMVGVIHRMAHKSPQQGIPSAWRELSKWRTKHPNNPISKVLEKVEDNLLASSHHYTMIVQPYKINYQGEECTLLARMDFGVGHGTADVLEDGAFLRLGGKEVSVGMDGYKPGVKMSFRLIGKDEDGDVFDEFMTLERLVRDNPGVFDGIGEGQFMLERGILSYEHDFSAGSILRRIDPTLPDEGNTVIDNFAWKRTEEGVRIPLKSEDILEESEQQAIHMRADKQRQVTGTRTPSFITFESMMELVKYIESPEFEQLWKYALIGNNCRDFSQELHDFIVHSKPGKHLDVDFQTKFMQSRLRALRDGPSANELTVEKLGNFMVERYKDIWNKRKRESAAHFSIEER